jgi:hypothetical protein
VDRCVAPVDRNGISLEVELWLTAFSSAGKLSPSSSFNSAGVDQGGEQRGAIAVWGRKPEVRSPWEGILIRGAIAAPKNCTYIRVIQKWEFPNLARSRVSLLNLNLDLM